MLQFERFTLSGRDTIKVAVDRLIIAGWAGRDEAALRHHVEELAAIGVPRPSSMPVFYRAAAQTLTQEPILSVLGGDSSGEVEPVLFSFADGLWLGLGSDHTDRKAETMGIALSKQLCGKPVAGALWRLADVEAHWDAIEMRAFAVIDGQRVLYQEGTLASLRTPRDLLSRRPDGPELAAGTAMFCGTLGAIGGIRPASRFEMELRDPKLGRSITAAYDIEALPVVS
ncbi:MAG TPA: DUF2848 domain-containing protein [Bosea sp. (in: a-proteobacteria)]|jgi:hypothetical protein|uniref:DUF2848 domain-containing protein n=1 Tax=Bosea sp. (in: a-proteobacteria) TaxID=1871050 RepID=UPI002E0D4DE8|nr:DUF2848 domain-containing protein [Bosea sp. (in: a-proteobacteria)]